MPAPVPTLDDFIAGIKTVMDAINPTIGTVVDRRHTYEDDVSYIVRNSLITSGTLKLWQIDLADDDPSEGLASQEFYTVHTVDIEQWSVETGDADWSKTARNRGVTVCNELTGDAAVFAIAGQRQLFTPETAQILFHGKDQIIGVEGPQMIYKTIVRVLGEARRWS